MELVSVPIERGHVAVKTSSSVNPWCICVLLLEVSQHLPVRVGDGGALVADNRLDYGVPPRMVELHYVLVSLLGAVGYFALIHGVG